MAKKGKAAATGRGGAYVIRSAESGRVTIKGSRSGKSGTVRAAIKNGQQARKSK